MITVNDIVQVLCDGDTAVLDALCVGDAMTTPALSVQRDFLIVDALRMMRMSGVRSVLVLAGTQPVGLLSYTDVLRGVGRDAASSLSAA